MKNSRTKRNLGRLVILSMTLFALAMLSSARTMTTSVSIVNNSNKAVVNVYLSHVNSDDWGVNQLGDTTISPGQSFSLNNVACDQQQVKVISEDEDGCYSSTVVSCGSSSTWTITNSTAKDCGGS
jgi:hypothetical protein